MSRGRAELIEMRGKLYCYCGKRVGAKSHNREQCLLFLKKLPGEGGGFPVASDIPMVLFQECEDAGVSKGLELYLDLWSGRYRRALEALSIRFPNHYLAYVALIHDAETAAEAAEWLGEAAGVNVTAGVVRQWKRRGLLFVRNHVGRPETWGGPEPRVTLDVSHDPSSEAHKAMTAELVRINAPKAPAA